MNKKKSGLKALDRLHGAQAEQISPLLFQLLPSPSWCCWPVWTAVPTPASTCCSAATCPRGWWRSCVRLSPTPRSPCRRSPPWSAPCTSASRTCRTAGEQSPECILQRQRDLKYQHEGRKRPGHVELLEGGTPCRDVRFPMHQEPDPLFFDLFT